MPNGRKRIRGLLGLIRAGEEMVEVGLGEGSERGRRRRGDGAESREGSRSARGARERRGTGVTCVRAEVPATPSDGLALTADGERAPVRVWLGPGNLVSRPLSDVDRQLLHSSLPAKKKASPFLSVPPPRDADVSHTDFASCWQEPVQATSEMFGL
jgi:hypothetical protein